VSTSDLPPIPPIPVARHHDQVRQAIAALQSFDGLMVLSCIGADGVPRLLLPESVRGRVPDEVAVVVPASEVLPELEAEPRVALLCRDLRSGITYQLAGRAEVGERRGDAGADTARPAVGGTGRTLLITVERVEVTGGEATRPRPGRGAVSADERPAVLQVDGLSIHYGATRAVHELTMSVTRGEIFGLLGPNGAGKTSTLSAIEGLFRPGSGTIRLDGIDVLRHPLAARTRMGVQLQTTSFQSNLTIRQILRLYAGLYGVRMSGADLSATIASAGLSAETDKPFKQLSGGQQQRLALQIAVIHQPVLLLLDEPTAGLDPQARRQLWARIEGLRREGGSILLTTHSMEEAQAVCDRVAIMDHGRVLTCGSPAELITRHRDDPAVLAVAHGNVTLDDVFVGLTGSTVRD
jgi:ABC-2 type transport system ATP-binding protein